MLTFLTPTALDIDGMLIQGLSVKGSGDAIGRFGTGFKYAVAGILRSGGSIKALSGEDTYEFSTTPAVFRGKSYTQVTLNGKQLHFTTGLGKHWKRWQLYRELYANTLDEGGHVVEGEAAPKEGWSAIQVAGLDDVHRKRTRYFLDPEEKALFRVGDLEVMGIGPERPAGIFNKGVLVDGNLASLFRYNLTGLEDLTEDRTLAAPHMTLAHIHNRICTTCDDPDVLVKLFLDTPEAKHIGFYELDLPSDSRSALQETYTRLCAMPAGRRCPERFRALERLHRTEEAPAPVTLGLLDRKRLQRALEFLHRVGLGPTHEIETYASLGCNIMGRAEDGKIKLARPVFDKGVKWVAATILEEEIHLTHGYADCTYGMQNYLFDLIVTQSEKIEGEPL